MANKKKTKKAQKEATANAGAATSVKAAKAAPKQSAARRSKPQKSAKKSSGKPGFLSRMTGYFANVRTEMRRVVWPTKKELLNYSVAVCASLIVVGIVIALLDVAITQGLVLFSGLRG
ncbi:preprotein translocase subunit SecE [Collinsella sp. AGMB00827]|uniref:Protein translocase subunit SecE n=1 Tax=Collinsella ureilytica TaxID=2869515 RepID=A0ABS7MJZ7_9ACTN|nr:preprotein translocase subunit SecE [Collinsella urealyticum]MBY4797406.1 preprotein translocase subunit SecE [Collinsella urealyticum]